MAADFQLLIGGAWVDAGDGGYDIVNPATEEVVGEAPNASVADAEAACAAAAEAFPAWSQTSPEHRCEQVESNIVPRPPAVMPTTALAPGGIIGAIEHRAPVGVVACITSYNFPMTNMAGKLAPALAMGNTVVVKPAWQDPLAVIRMCELFEKAGFPPGVVNVVTSQGPEPSEALV